MVILYKSGVIETRLLKSVWSYELGKMKHNQLLNSGKILIRLFYCHKIVQFFPNTNGKLIIVWMWIIDLNCFSLTNRILINCQLFKIYLFSELIIDITDLKMFKVMLSFGDVIIEVNCLNFKIRAKFLLAIIQMLGSNSSQMIKRCLKKHFELHK